MDEALQDRSKITWASASCRISMKAKAELTRIAAEKGMNINQYILYSIVYASENDNREINDCRYEDEYDDLQAECMKMKVESIMLRNEVKRLRSMLNGQSVK